VKPGPADLGRAAQTLITKHFFVENVCLKSDLFDFCKLDCNVSIESRNASAGRMLSLFLNQ